MKPQEVGSKTVQRADLSLFHLLKCHLGPFAYLFSGKMVTGTNDRDCIIGLIGEMKELRAKPLLHFSRGFVGEGEGHDLRDGQGVRLSHEEVKNPIDQDRGLAGPGSRNHHDIAVPGCLRQEPILGVRQYQRITHRVLSAFLAGVILVPGETGTSATRPWHRGVGTHRSIRSSRNSRREE